MLNSRVFFIALAIFPFVLVAQVDHWESVVLQSDTWSYLVPTSQPSVTWNNLTYDDSSWKSGSSGFGFGDGDDATLLETGTIAVYIRKKFDIIDLDEIEGLILSMDFDDGFVAYLNGVEVTRAYMFNGVPGYNQGSNGLHEALLYQGQTPEQYTLDPEVLVAGTNILAIEVHNENSNSSDFSAIPFLSVGLTTSETRYRETPEWFVAPVTVSFSSSNLPIILIETGGREIPSDPKINATMKIIYRGEGERNLLTDASNEEYLNYSGDIGIEVRGSSSSLLDKKQYSFTTTEAGEDLNVSLLGMPKEHDWILNGLAYDPSYLRDYLSYNLSRQIGNYASRTQYAEVMLNGEYIGLYVLQEKLKADDNRIDIKKIELEDNDLPKLSGGYITKADKLENEILAWIMPNTNGWQTDFIHEIPKSNEATAAQTAYIQGEFERLRVAASAGNMDVTTGIPSIIDMPSFIDYLLLCEFASNADSYQYSTFFHKDRNGKLRAGPLWDFNLTYGNDLFFWGYDRSRTDIWQFEYENTGPTFWKDLYSSAEFRCYMAKRWNELTQPGQPIHQLSVYEFIDATVLEFSEAAVRENARWASSADLNTEIANIKSFVDTRIKWMNTRLGSFSSCGSVSVPSIAITKIHYHPQSIGDYEDSEQEFMEITNIGASEADLTGVYIGGTGLVYQFPIGTKLRAGGRLILANESDGFKEAFGFLPFDEFSRNINDGGQTIRFLDAYGNVVDKVTYGTDGEWPASADGGGDYLEVIDPMEDNDDPANWRASSASLVTGVDRLAPVLTVYPNPTEDVISINATSRIKLVMLFDSQGNYLMEVAPQSRTFVLDLNSRASGIYFIQIETESGVFTRKVRKQ